jgi:hypothetical protein
MSEKESLRKRTVGFLFANAMRESFIAPILLTAFLFIIVYTLTPWVKGVLDGVGGTLAQRFEAFINPVRARMGGTTWT